MSDARQSVTNRCHLVRGHDRDSKAKLSCCTNEVPFLAKRLCLPQRIIMKASTRPQKTTLQSLIVISCATAHLAMAQSIWTGGGADANWSTPGNWSSGVVPNNNAVTFPDGAFPITTNAQGLVNNVVQSSTAISSITFNNLNGNFDTTQISSGTILTINGTLLSVRATTPQTAPLSV